MGKTTTDDTGAQCFLLGSVHLPGLGLYVLRDQPELCKLYCSRQHRKVRGEHHLTAESVVTGAMVYVIEWDIVLVSRSVLEVLEKLGCIPKHFPSAGEFLEYYDKALTGNCSQSTHIPQAGSLVNFTQNSYPTIAH